MSNVHLNQEKKKWETTSRRKEKKGQHLGGRKKKKSEKSNVRTKPMCKCIRTFLSIKHPHFFPSIFSPFWREKFLVGPERKHLDLTIYFPLFSLHPTKHTPKKFSFPFSLQSFPSILFYF